MQMHLSQKNIQLKQNYQRRSRRALWVRPTSRGFRWESRQGLTRGARHLGVGSGKAVHPIAQALAQARTDFGQVCNKNLLLAFLLLRVKAFIHSPRMMLIGNPRRAEKRIMADNLGLSA